MCWTLCWMLNGHNFMRISVVVFTWWKRSSRLSSNFPRITQLANHWQSWDADPCVADLDSQGLLLLSFLFLLYFFTFNQHVLCTHQVQGSVLDSGDAETPKPWCLPCKTFTGKWYWNNKQSGSAFVVRPSVWGKASLETHSWARWNQILKNKGMRSYSWNQLSWSTSYTRKKLDPLLCGDTKGFLRKAMAP